MSYTEKSLLFKALADPIRLQIVDMISCGELCACMILERFSVTQPTLSHHMKILCDCDLVDGRKEGKWTYYSLNTETISLLKDCLCAVTEPKNDCVCKEVCDCE